jgi:hypothetical protein
MHVFAHREKAGAHCVSFPPPAHQQAIDPSLFRYLTYIMTPDLSA